MAARLVLFVALVVIAPGVCAESDNSAIFTSKLAKFQLYTKCRGVYLVVENLPDDAEKIGLKKEEIIVAVESRLRSSNLYQSEKYGVYEGSITGYPYLYVNISVVGKAFSIDLKLNKDVQDPFSARSNYATTWNIALLETHGNSADYILSSLPRRMDHFVNEWYKVNKPEGKCVE